MRSFFEPIIFDANELDTRLHWANEKEVAPQYLHASSFGDAYTVCWFVERGQVRIYGKAGEQRVEKGAWLFPAAGAFTQEFSPGAKILSIRFDLSLRGGSPLFVRPRHRTLVAGHSPSLERAARNLIARVHPFLERGTMEINRSKVSLYDHLRIDAIFQEWLAEYVYVMLEIGELPTKRPEHDPHLQKALTLLEEHPMREPFSVNALASAAGLSTNHLIRIFHHTMGTTPHVYYEKRRLRLAHRAMELLTVPLKEIAFDLGFSSPAHFSTWFKKREGVSPRVWRRRLKEKINY